MGFHVNVFSSSVILLFKTVLKILNPPPKKTTGNIDNFAMTWWQVRLLSWGMLEGKSLCHCFLHALFTFVSFIPSLKVVHYEEFEASNLIWLSCFISPREASCSACMVCTSPQEIQPVMHPKLTQLPGHGKVRVIHLSYWRFTLSSIIKLPNYLELNLIAQYYIAFAS